MRHVGLRQLLERCGLEHEGSALYGVILKSSDHDVWCVHSHHGGFDSPALLQRQQYVPGSHRRPGDNALSARHPPPAIKPPAVRYTCGAQPLQRGRGLAGSLTGARPSQRRGLAKSTVSSVVGHRSGVCVRIESNCSSAAATPALARARST